ncbi:hypothetical protein [uncultured Shewanella sp.]|uniref:hypothetical protein n=1 Tax=uncultured Shewanella sp. TaxID=173975 RepID=UPI002606EEDE|nr:hypothetical protein [uncultured Shewanella sp.]
MPKLTTKVINLASQLVITSLLSLSTISIAADKIEAIDSEYPKSCPLTSNCEED